MVLVMISISFSSFCLFEFVLVFFCTSSYTFKQELTNLETQKYCSKRCFAISRHLRRQLTGLPHPIEILMPGTAEFVYIRFIFS